MSEEHLYLSNYIKNVHSNLRQLSKEIGVELAWQEHCNNVEVLKKYAHCMEKLATKHWERNCSNDSNIAMSRVKWAADFCYGYFIAKGFKQFREKELKIALKLDISINFEENVNKPIILLDVGSCYNPFISYTFLEVLALDLCPANNLVYECDFLSVPVSSDIILTEYKIKSLKQNHFDVVTFCFLLEYIPNSDLRIIACKKAYNVLKPGGLLIINTPDSKHVSANSKIMKCWRFTLAHIGFSRIKYEKFKHMHCMAFRKCLHKSMSMRWADIHKEPYMNYSIHIPQDLQKLPANQCIGTEYVLDIEDFKELPFAEVNFSTT